MKKSHRQTKFSEFSAPQRVGIVLLGAVQVTLLIASQIDIQRRPAEQIKGRKIVWRLVCIINIIGPLSYFRWGRTSGEGTVSAQVTEALA